MPTPQNVDKELHNVEVAAGNLIEERTTSKAKRSLRGAAGGVYIGPVLSTAAIDNMRDTAAIGHATTKNAGGLDGSTGYRKANAYSVDGDATGQGMGDGGTLTARPNPGATADGGRNLYRGNGTFGGSVVGYPAQRVGQRAAAATGSSLPADGGSAAFIDKRSDASDRQALGSSGRGTRVLSAGGTVTVARSGKMARTGQARIPVPVLVTGDPNAGEIQIVDGTGGAVHADLHADDITGGANGLAGCVIYVFTRGTDTDEDGELVRKGDFDTTTEGAVTGLTGLTAGTYAFYAAFKTAATQGSETVHNIGPWSNRLAVAIT